MTRLPTLRQIAKRRHPGDTAIYLSDVQYLKELERADFDARHPGVPVPAAPALPTDPRIGMLNSGVYYAFASGYDQPEVRGTLAQVEAALAQADAQ